MGGKRQDKISLEERHHPMSGRSRESWRKGREREKTHAHMISVLMQTDPDQETDRGGGDKKHRWTQRDTRASLVAQMAENLPAMQET